MTWGSNASYDRMECRWCGGDMIDDRSQGLTTHEQQCPEAPWHVKVARWLASKRSR